MTTHAVPLIINCGYWMKEKIKSILNLIEARCMRKSKKKESLAKIDKCQLCGLRCSYPSYARDQDNRVNQAQRLYDTGIVKTKILRDIHMTIGKNCQDYIYYCAVGNHRYWKKPLKKCPDWLFLADTLLTINDYIALYQAKKLAKTSHLIGVFSLAFTVLGILIGLLIADIT